MGKKEQLVELREELRDCKERWGNAESEMRHCETVICDIEREIEKLEG